MTKEDILIALDDVKDKTHLIGVSQFLYGLAETTGNTNLLEAAEIVQCEVEALGIENQYDFQN